MGRNEIYASVIDRSDPDQVTTVYPAGHPDNPSDKPVESTRVQEIRKDLRQHGWFFGRSDAALVTIQYADGSCDQLAARLTRAGIEWGGTQRYLTKLDQQDLERIRLRLIELADGGYPEMGYYLGDTIQMADGLLMITRHQER